MSIFSLNDQIFFLMKSVYDEISKRHQNIRGARRPMLDATDEIASALPLMERMANEENAPTNEEMLAWISKGLRTLDQWIYIIDGPAPDGLGRRMKNWRITEDTLKAEAELVREQSTPGMAP